MFENVTPHGLSVEAVATGETDVGSVGRGVLAFFPHVQLPFPGIVGWLDVGDAGGIFCKKVEVTRLAKPEVVIAGREQLPFITGNRPFRIVLVAPVALGPRRTIRAEIKCRSG